MRVIGWKEQQAYRAADRVVCLLANAEAHMISRGLPGGGFVWIPNGGLREEIRSAVEPAQTTHPPLTESSDKGAGKRVVLYAGANGTT